MQLPRGRGRRGWGRTVRPRRLSISLLHSERVRRCGCRCGATRSKLLADFLGKHGVTSERGLGRARRRVCGGALPIKQMLMLRKPHTGPDPREWQVRPQGPAVCTERLRQKCRSTRAFLTVCDDSSCDGRRR
eukprot:gene16600-biopygen17270